MRNQDELHRSDVPFTALSNCVLDDERLTQHGLLVYMAIARFAGWKSRIAWPGIETIATNARVSRSSALRGIKNLRDLGYLHVTKEISSNGWHNKYKLEDIFKADTKPLKTKRGSVSETQPSQEGSVSGTLGVVSDWHPNKSYYN
jgi:hypothetical protein